MLQHEAVFLCSFRAKVPPAHGEPWEDPFLLRNPEKSPQVRQSVHQLVASITIIVSPREHHVADVRAHAARETEGEACPRRLI